MLTSKFEQLGVSGREWHSSQNDYTQGYQQFHESTTIELGTEASPSTAVSCHKNNESPLKQFDKKQGAITKASSKAGNS